MIGIESIGWTIPAGRRTVAEIAAEHRVSEQSLRAFGLEQKAVPGPDDHPSTLAAAATRDALAAADRSPEDIDLLIFAGVTRDRPAPWIAAFGVLHELGATRAAAFDLSARCPGLTDALWVASNLIRGGSARTAVVCAGDRYDYLLPPERNDPDAASSAFGAGGAAAVLTADAANEIVAYSHRVSDDISAHDRQCAVAGGSRRPFDAQVLDERAHQWTNRMTVAQTAAIRAFYRTADRHNIASVSAQAGFEDIDFLAGSILDVKDHQAQLRELGISPDKVSYTTPSLGHLGPCAPLASLGLALAAGRPIGPRLVINTRTFVYANAIALRGASPTLGIRILDRATQE